ncbi:MAG: hypothetical protein QXK29_01805 [Candidatus Bathyarchaeia archaeon]
MGKPDDLVNALADLKEEEALRLVKDLLNAGEDPFKIIQQRSQPRRTSKNPENSRKV